MKRTAVQPIELAKAVSMSKDGLRISCWIQPRASRSAVVGMHGFDLKLALAAPPVDGKANEELREFMASLLRLPKSSIQIAAGLSSRKKTLLISGIEADSFAEAICK